MKNYFDMCDKVRRVGCELGDEDLVRAADAFELLLEFASCADAIPRDCQRGMLTAAETSYQVHFRPGLVERVKRMMASYADREEEAEE